MSGHLCNVLTMFERAKIAMRRNVMIRLMCTLATVIFGLVLPALAQTDKAAPSRQTEARIRDNAGLFSAQAIKDANADIQKIKQDHRKDLMFETFAAIPEDR